MTGNVVFLGFGLAGAGDIAVSASLVAILAFTRRGERTGPNPDDHHTVPQAA